MGTLSHIKGEVTWTFRATGHTAQDRHHKQPVLADQVTVRFAPERTDGTGRLYWDVSVYGQALKKDGTPGQTRVEHQFSSNLWAEDAPEWITDLASRLEPLARCAINAPANDRADERAHWRTAQDHVSMVNDRPQD
jgi:hypothetical protein